MNKVRYEALVASQSAIARKVLSVVPIQEHWSARQIYAELHRQTQATIDRRILDGCMRALVDAGLVHESPRDSYIREMPKEEQPKMRLVKDEPITTTEPTMSMPNPAPTPIKTTVLADPLERLANVAKRLRGMTDEIEELALEVGHRMESVDADAKKAAQLKALLKDFAG